MEWVVWTWSLSKAWDTQQLLDNNGAGAKCLKQSNFSTEFYIQPNHPSCAQVKQRYFQTHKISRLLPSLWPRASCSSNPRGCLDSGAGRRLGNGHAKRICSQQTQQGSSSPLCLNTFRKHFQCRQNWRISEHSPPSSSKGSTPATQPTTDGKYLGGANCMCIGHIQTFFLVTNP